MEITYYGHSSFLININGKKVVIDPFISPNSLASNIEVDKIPADYILLTHGHADHVADVETIYKNNQNPQIISTFEVVGYFQNLGHENAHPMNHGGSLNLDFGTIKMVNAVHSSSMPDGSYGGNPSGFVIQGEGKTFYYAGDTALTMDMKLIGDEFSVDFAFMPIGDNFTMGIEDAVKAADFVDTNQIIGMHYDTMDIIKLDREKSNQIAKNGGKDLVLFEIGETKSF